MPLVRIDIMEGRPPEKIRELHGRVAARRGLRGVQDAARSLWHRARGLPAPAGLAGLRRGGGRRDPLPVSRLAVRHRRYLPGPARGTGGDQLPLAGARGGWAELPCNFVQIMENAFDPHHTEWLHRRFFEFMARHQGFDAPSSFGKKHVKVGFDAFDWGIIKRRVVEGASEEDDDWKIGHPLVFPYNMRVGGANIEQMQMQMQIRVPVDRTTTRFML